ncbi:translation initiation factor IF-2-like [Mustela erminea]|uniref:translation initiation factor IF-2-like n=1 Tax=Mustela erminea TaxID=36723 RepID=UPI001386A994|nr:translation initiation factor IF-2-like [Mustela erminea]
MRLGGPMVTSGARAPRQRTRAGGDERRTSERGRAAAVRSQPRGDRRRRGRRAGRLRRPRGPPVRRRQRTRGGPPAPGLRRDGRTRRTGWSAARRPRGQPRARTETPRPVGAAPGKSDPTWRQVRPEAGRGRSQRGGVAPEAPGIPATGTDTARAAAGTKDPQDGASRAGGTQPGALGAPGGGRDAGRGPGAHHDGHKVRINAPGPSGRACSGLARLSSLTRRTTRSSRSLSPPSPTTLGLGASLTPRPGSVAGLVKRPLPQVPCRAPSGFSALK